MRFLDSGAQPSEMWTTGRSTGAGDGGGGYGVPLAGGPGAGHSGGGPHGPLVRIRAADPTAHAGDPRGGTVGGRLLPPRHPLRLPHRR
eukprot:415414-Prorocentrum_minimum.AAC.1